MNQQLQSPKGEENELTSRLAQDKTRETLNSLEISRIFIHPSNLIKIIDTFFLNVYLIQQTHYLYWLLTRC